VTSQPDLDFGAPLPPLAERPARGGYAWPPGSGPAGETCGSCRHLVAHGRTRNYWKCGLVAWTHGAATDIRKRSPACELWAEPVED
jgi:hypothetical protein